ncbi:MAG TPA: sialidase family protein, partial [Acidimicrobiales bacterium]|nr:sialidase family protein [Acidimicrobiales bacterium]
MRGRCGWIGAFGLAASTMLALVLPSAGLAAPVYRVGPISDISAACSGQNAEVEQAVDPQRGYVYEEWMGCDGIAFARSTDGGRTFGPPIRLPGSTGSNAGSWDPALAVAPNGTVYAGFMTGGTDDRVFPVIDASFDHGASFPQSAALMPHQTHNWGD